ncbi:hypothetical protein M9H77_07536 [Catharanthus roseus]|uniref:Uncharacterized protein n=1 Tax=Catharanthus roseus TaxID=4058 RepID=A0ACC0BVH3_CATRO|nr:hypothetical protein M9H77_07536 [Catharanthus roseus]
MGRTIPYSRWQGTLPSPVGFCWTFLRHWKRTTNGRSTLSLPDDESMKFNWSSQFILLIESRVYVLDSIEFRSSILGDWGFEKAKTRNTHPKIIKKRNMLILKDMSGLVDRCNRCKRLVNRIPVEIYSNISEMEKDLQIQYHL